MYNLSGDAYLYPINLYIGGFGTGLFSQSGGTLQSYSEVLGVNNTGANVFTQTGGVNNAYSQLTIQSGTYNLYGGTLYAASLNGAFSTQPNGTFVMGGVGTEYGYFQNFGTFTYGGGTFNGTLENDGTVILTSGFAAEAGVINNEAIYVGNQSVFDGGGQGFDNEGEIILAGGYIGSVSTTTNNGLITGYGTIKGEGFTNTGLMTASGFLTLADNGYNQNLGTINMAAGYQLRLTGAMLTNQGTLNINGGIVTGPVLLENMAGGVVTGPGSILTPFSNDSGGTVQISAGTLNVSLGFDNYGLVSLTGVTVNLTGGAVTNQGTIQGLGNVGSALVDNYGTLEAIGGTLSINGALINESNGQILAGAGGKVLVSKGLSSNNGLINLTGGTFDNNGYGLTNSGEISGYGSFRTGGLTNNATMTFTGGQTTVNGAVSNSGTTTVAQNAATFTGLVTNNAGALFKTVGTTVTFAGGFTNNGSYLSDPSTQSFSSLTIGATGLITAGAGDVFDVSGNLVNDSTQNTVFDMSEATLVLEGAVNHQITWGGVNLGGTTAGFTNNFAIGTLELQAGGSLDLLNGSSGTALYVENLELDGGLSQLNLIDLNGGTIYYDPTQASNAYLDDKSHALQAGGSISPVPEPGTLAVILEGFGLLCVITWRVRRRGSV